jgi:DNA-binding response OmpR family regulator
MHVLVLVDGRHAERLEQIAQGETTRAKSAADAEHRLRAEAFDTLVFDAELVDDGFLRRVRRHHPRRALVAWLSYASSDVTAALLEAGADEVLDTGMGSNELAARLENAVRRASGTSTTVLELGPLALDAAQGEARWEGRRLALTPREREVLHVLAEAAGRTVRREDLYRQVWGYAMARGDRSVDVNVKRLRDKLTAAGTEIAIETEPGVGYRLEVARTEAALTTL